MPTTSCSTSPEAVTDQQIKCELVEVLNVFGKLATMTPDEVKATIRAVSEGLHSRNVRFAAYREAMTRFRIGACGRPEKDRAFAPVAPVIVSLAHECECELRASEYRERQRQIAPPPVEECEPLTAEQRSMIDRVRAAMSRSTKPIPKEATNGR
ncbi:MAG: hypothetical protein Unbinned3696contig1008_44 [Prokaryotic dsDNA virus sp.]|nr:MAG: hypothetical protein Unbinned3696contig1008_44 [Prokaryotic dsDNA virus sp.]|tara:strand:+ start:6550 stop:7011 length:462 start_codon:yes stop_codon:yes gene_type:complete